MRTAIHGGDIVAYRAGGHRLLRGGVLVFEDDRIVFVGRRYEGPVDARIDASDKLVMPLLQLELPPAEGTRRDFVVDLGLSEKWIVE